MAKKKTSKKATAGKTAKKSSKKTNVVFMQSAELDDDTMIHMVGDVDDVAIEYNKHFPQYLLGIKRFPSAPPGHYSISDANEADYYMNSSFLVWQSTPGAVDWVEKCFAKKR
jgi:hypothetical protein